MQRNWIGRSEGCTFSFGVDGLSERIPVFTTRVDTVYGVTFVVLAPEHPLGREDSRRASSTARAGRSVCAIVEKQVRASSVPA